MSFGKGISD